MPPERLRVENFFSEDRDAEDSIYATQAAVIADYEFDRDRFRIAESTYRSTDLAHWLALDVATRALADAGFAGGEGLPRTTTGVILGNTLTGEFSRANVLRLRWHYVRAAAELAWTESGLPAETRAKFFRNYEAQFKAPFPPVDSDTLAGGLSNTIAGRICNYYDLKGGCYTVDGACASSLLAVANACSAITSGDLDVALAGGVDLSLDPFELIGFAKVGALAADAMRVFDVRSRGFWPGEGCGFLVLMKQSAALAENRRIYATIPGWGISSDGHGGLTRPEFDGQVLALQRAYRRAGFGADTVGYFEGHGTGTNVGDATELRVLANARLGAKRPASIGSVKANIGHTKAAAGVAGLIKAVMSVHSGIIPPTTGCEEPHEELKSNAALIRIEREAKPWEENEPRRAGASAMGFGGINSHIVIEADRSGGVLAGGSSRGVLAARPDYQDAELFLIEAETPDALLNRIKPLREIAARLSLAELTDLAATLAKDANGGALRAAIVAATPAQLATRLESLESWLRAGTTERLDVANETFLGTPRGDARIGFLFPGQASPVYRDGGIFARRFDIVRRLYETAHLPNGREATATSVVQPAVATASAAGLRVLAELGIEARVSVGHSLGEISAMCWAGAIGESALLEIAIARGRAMMDVSGPAGAMAAIEASADQVSAFLADDRVHVVGLNSPRQTVVAGETAAVGAMMDRARSRGFRVAGLPVSHAFHTPLMEPATSVLAEALLLHPFQPHARKFISTVRGAALAPNEDLRDLLCRQMTAPVRFLEALRTAAAEVDLLIEVGPGRILTDLAADAVKVPAIALDACGSSLRGLLAACGAAHVLGDSLNRETLFAGRFTRPFDIARRPTFFANPCESLPSSPSLPSLPKPPRPAAVPTSTDAWSTVREVVAQQMKLPPAAVQRDSRMLVDLHLNSITVGQLVAETARRLGAPQIVDPTRFANATVGQIAEAFEELKSNANGHVPADEIPSGIESWIEPFRVALVERARPEPTSDIPAGEWNIVAPAAHPLTDSLEMALCGHARGVVVCLPENTDEHISLLLQGARLLAGNAHFIVVHHGTGVAAFARTLHRETPGVTTCVVCVPPNHPRAVEWIVAETRAGVGYTEAHYDERGTRREPELQWLPPVERSNEFPVGAKDVVLVSGGGKGITAECALALARRSGAALGLLGRSAPENDSELRQNLQRIRESGVRVEYVAADVADAEAVRAAVAQIEKSLGTITGIVHGAGRNVPHSLATLDEAAFHETLAPKLCGAENILAAVNADTLRLFVTFGSIIARIGMAGQADYAVANERLAALTERFQREHPDCRCRCLEWSVWSGLGMGEKLGRVEALLQHGVTAIPPDEGARLFCELIASRAPEVSIVVTGRFGNPPTLPMDLAPLPRGRFLEEPRVQFPTELICDTQLSADADPYGDDHMLQGQRLFPAVVALEAMAQVAMALGRSAVPPVFEKAQFHRPVVVSASGPTTIRIQALMRVPGRIEVALLCADTGFAVRHFEAVCCFDEVAPRELPLNISADDQARVPLDPVADLYEERLFHTGRFRRVQAYRRLTATECVAEISASGNAPWFRADLPQPMALGDAAGRDAALHAIQACVPHRRILPIGVERMIVNAEPSPSGRVVWAKERSHTADEFLYDVLVRDHDGRLLESWEGLHLRAVEAIAPRHPWPAPLLAAYLERRLADLLPGSPISVAALTGGSEAAFTQLLGTSITITHRADGKPEVNGANGHQVSSAHSGEFTLAISSERRIACDIESVKAWPSSEWSKLLSPAQRELAEAIVRESGKDFDTAATRIWAAAECLKKAGIPSAPSWPLTLGACDKSGWSMLASPSVSVATWVGKVQASAQPVAFAFLAHTPVAKEQRVFEIRHVVTFEETNVVGNVYFVNHLSWQGRCREMFLRKHAAGSIKELDEQGLSLATSSVAVEYFEELFPFDEVVIRMTLRELTPSSAALTFDYLRQNETSLTLIARGQHTVAVKRKAGIAVDSQAGRAVFPPELHRALEEYLPRTH